MSTNDCTVLLSDSITPLCIRAKLGDTIAEANLLNMFDSTKNYSEKAKLVFELSEAGTKRSITHLIKKFNKPVFRYDKYGCKLESLRLVIIESFQRYYPKESLFNEEWNKMAGHERYYKEAIDTNKVNSFLNHIVHFFDETYNTKPEDDPPEPILIKSGDCGMPVIPF